MFDVDVQGREMSDKSTVDLLWQKLLEGGK